MAKITITIQDTPDGGVEVSQSRIGRPSPADILADKAMGVLKQLHSETARLKLEADAKKAATKALNEEIRAKLPKGYEVLPRDCFAVNGTQVFTGSYEGGPCCLRMPNYFAAMCSESNRLHVYASWEDAVADAQVLAEAAADETKAVQLENQNS